jgi:hypothetical protein
MISSGKNQVWDMRTPSLFASLTPDSSPGVPETVESTVSTAHAAFRQLKRVAHHDFSRAKSCDGEVLNLKGFEFGALHRDAADGQPAYRQCADRTCAHRDRADGRGHQSQAAGTRIL